MPQPTPAAPAPQAGSAREFTQDLAQVRLDNALLLFEEFVRASARHADAAALKGLERRFAERIQIQPSYWSQIKSRSRQIGERLARQFEEQCHKPRGWMDTPPGKAAAATAAAPAHQALHDATPRDDDERFILGLVLTYYRRHPQRARTRLLDLLGEVLTTAAPAAQAIAPPQLTPRMNATFAAPTAPTAPADDPHTLWLKTQSGVAPLKRKPR